MKPRRVMLAVLAHPDDETFGIGGTLALYAKRGVDVYLICATRGEAGMVQEDHLEGYTSIAELRENELRCAAQMLGIRGVFFLDYRDSGMPNSVDNRHLQALINAPVQEVIGKIVTHIRKLKPQVVITFDSIGVYSHPDHIYIHHATRKAFYLASEPTFECQGLSAYQPQKLYYYTISKIVMRLLVRLMPLFGKDPTKYGRNGDINLTELLKDNYPVNARIDYREVSKIRSAASFCYVSQGGRQQYQGAAGLLRGWASTKEVFIRGYPDPEQGHIEHDLFENVNIYI